MKKFTFNPYPFLLAFGLAACAPVAGQTLHADLSLANIAPNMYVQLQAAKTDTSFSLKQRLLPGSAQPLFYTENVSVNGSEVSGKAVVYGSYQYSFRGFAQADSVHLQLTDKAGNTAGLLHASARPPAIRTDYKKLATQILDTLQHYLFNRAYLDSTGYKTFAATLRQYGFFLQDDLEFIGAVNREMRKLPFSHTYFTKADYNSFAQMLNRQFSGTRPVEFKLLNPTTAYLKISSFDGNGSNIAESMERLIAGEATNLIVDLRGNSGGGAEAALQLVKYLAPVYVPAGALVTNKWFAAEQRPPVAADYKNFYSFSKGTTMELIQAMKTWPGVVLAVTPSEKQFRGRVYVLTDGKTASTCEPLVYALKSRGRATVVGQHTAGAMLSAGGFWLNTGYVLSLPVADYFTYDGVRLDRRGVAPTVPVPAAQALEKTLELIAN